MSVGNALLDLQQRKLCGLGRRTIELLNAPVVDDYRFHTVLNDIVDVVRWRFQAEEARLESNQCPALQEHRAEHHHYLERLTHLLFDGARGVIDRTGLAHFVHELINDHILQRDVPLKDYMR